MSAADPQHIAFACLAYLLLDISDTVDRIGSYPLEWHSRGYRACDHSRRKLWFGRKARAGRHVCGLQTIWIVGPFLWKIQRAIDERMAMTGNVGREDADLAVRNLACRTGVLPRHTARRVALLEKAGLVDDEDGIVICQMLDDIVAHDIAQGIGIPIPATKDSLLPPWTRIASCLRPHPAGLALLITEQTFQKQACVPRNPFLPEQWTYPLLKLLKRRSPQRKRLFNRRCLRPRSSNHGCPWIQKSSERATVMLSAAPPVVETRQLRRAASGMSVQRRLAATPAISICVANLAIDSSGVRSDIVRRLRGCRILPPRPIIELISNVTPNQKRPSRPYFRMICGMEKQDRQKTTSRRFERRLQTSLL